ncbi:MAG: hypothetical protein ACLFVU_01895 [Phycisphaerae bacterium]
MAYQSRLEIVVDSTKGERNLRRFDRTLGGVERQGNRTSRAMRGAGKSATRAGRSFDGASTALKSFIGIGTVAVFARMAKGSLAATDATNDYADALGMSTQKLLAMQSASETVQVDAGKLRDILKDTSEKIAEAYATGGGEAAEELERLGLSLEELNRLSPDEQLLAIADGLDEVGTRGERIQILEAFASDATMLLPLLEDNAAGMRRLMEDAIDSGRAMSDDLAQGASEANEALNDVRRQISAEFSRRVAENAENIERLADSMQRVASGAMRAAEEFANFSRWVGEATAAAVMGQELSGFGPEYDALVAQREQLEEVQRELESGRTTRDGFFSAPRRATAEDLIDDQGLLQLVEQFGSVEAAIEQTDRRMETFFDRARKEAPEAARSMAGLPSEPLRAMGSGESGPGFGSILTMPDAGDDSADRARETESEYDRLTDSLRRQRRELELTGEELFVYQEMAGLSGNETASQREKVEELASSLYRQRQASDEAAEAQREAQYLYESTRTPLERLNADMADYNELLESGAISWDTYARATMDAMESVEEKASDTSSDMANFWDEAARNMQRSLSDGFFSVMQGEFDSLGDRFKSTIDRMVADLMASQLMDFMSKELGGGGGGGGGWLSNLAGSFGSWAGNLFSFDGGGYTGNGTRTGGLDGQGGFLAMMHPRETVVDHSKGQQGSIKITQHFHGVRDATGVKEAGGRAAASAARTLQRARRDM